jgi:hypothetical protein
VNQAEEPLFSFEFQILETTKSAARTTEKTQDLRKRLFSATKLQRSWQFFWETGNIKTRGFPPSSHDEFGLVENI